MTRSRRCAFVVLVACTFCVWSGMNCPPGGGPNGNSNNNGNGNFSGPGVKVTLHGAYGTEQYMRAVVWVGNRAVTRAEAADPATLRSAGFADTDMNNVNIPGDLSRTFVLNSGEIATIVAVESEGNFGTTQWTDSPPAPLDSLVEFVSFSGAMTTTQAAGVATFGSSATGEVFVNFRRMPQILLYLWGATGVNWEFDIAPVLALPEMNSSYNNPFSSSGLIAAPNKSGYRNMQFKTGTTVTLTAAPSGEFLRWEDACGGSGEQCTLTFGGQSGAQDQMTTLVTGYLQCGSGLSTTYSGYSPGSTPPAGCMIVHP